MAVSAAALARALGVPVLLSWERLSTGVSYNLLSEKVYADPYPVYNEMRAKDPVHWSELARAWFLTRHADVRACLRDRRLGRNFRHVGTEVEFKAHPLDPRRQAFCDLVMPQIVQGAEKCLSGNQCEYCEHVTAPAEQNRPV